MKATLMLFSRKPGNSDLVTQIDRKIVFSNLLKLEDLA